MAAMREKYRLYHLHLLTEVMIEEMRELIRYGVSPLGVEYVPPLEKERQEKLRPLLTKLAESIKEAAGKMIEDGVAAPHGSLTSEEWLRIMLEELRMRVSTIGDSYAQELKGVTGFLHEMENVLAGKNRPDEKH
jgi:hypothetical protein